MAPARHRGADRGQCRGRATRAEYAPLAKKYQPSRRNWASLAVAATMAGARMPDGLNGLARDWARRRALDARMYEAYRGGAEASVCEEDAASPGSMRSRIGFSIAGRPT